MFGQLAVGTFLVRDFSVWFEVVNFSRSQTWTPNPLRSEYLTRSVIFLVLVRHLSMEPCRTICPRLDSSFSVKTNLAN